MAALCRHYLTKSPINWIHEHVAYPQSGEIVNIKVAGSGLQIGETIEPLLSGTMHYWRVSRSLWEECLLKVRDLGFRIIETYIPWSVHELEEGRFDFGEVSPEKDIGAFLRLSAKLGFYVMVRPGPHINAELTDFGYPARVLDNPRMQAAGPEGEPIILPAAPCAFPVPSYCSEPFWEAVAVWFDALAPLLKPHVYPNGPIIAVQCDNELSYFFRYGAYDQDYSDAAIAAYRAFLLQKYGEAENLSNAYGTTFRTFREVIPPTFFGAGSASELPYYWDWAEFKERVMNDALARIRTMWEQRGIVDVLFTHNIPPGLSRTPFNIPRDEQALDIVGQDFYPRKKDYPYLKQALLALEGQSRFPWSPEFGSGCYQLWPPVSLEDQKFSAKVALMHGLKGFNFYMIVERERWYGSPITRRAGIRKEPYAWYRGFLEMIRREQIFQLAREAKVLVLTNRLYDRHEKIATLFGNLPPMLVEQKLGPEGACDERLLGLGYCVAIEHDRMRRAAFDAMDKLGITYRWGDSESGMSLLRRHSVVICPSFEFMEERRQRELAEYMQLGGAVIMGPEVPSRDEFLRECSCLEGFVTRPMHKLACETDTLIFNVGGGRLVLIMKPPEPCVEKTVACFDEIFRFLRVNPTLPMAGPCDRTVFFDRERAVIFVANPSDEERRPVIETHATSLLADLETGEEFYGQGDVPVFMRPWQVRVLEMRRC
jgi:beta-galactosidase